MENKVKIGIQVKLANRSRESAERERQRKLIAEFKSDLTGRRIRLWGRLG